MSTARHIPKGGQQRGNAILISLLMMASALVITLGTVSIVASETRNAGLVPPSDRAYFKAESYVEQGLMNKKNDPSYDVPSLAAIPTLAVSHLESPCGASDCFTTTPRSEFNNGAFDRAGVLQDYFATTDIGGLATPGSSPADLTKQYEVDTSDPASVPNGGTSGTVQVDISSPGLKFKKLEVTVVASPKDLTAARGADFAGAASQTTPVFVDKFLLSPPSSTLSIQIGTNANNGLLNGELPGKNPVGDLYPPLKGYTYRLRIKPLGDSVSYKLTANSNAGGSPALKISSTDFTVQAIAQDGETRRGVRVTNAASQSADSIFDYVIFSDKSINKLKSKKPAR